MPHNILLCTFRMGICDGLNQSATQGCCILCNIYFYDNHHTNDRSNDFWTNDQRRQDHYTWILHKSHSMDEVESHRVYHHQHHRIRHEFEATSMDTTVIHEWKQYALSSIFCNTFCRAESPSVFTEMECLEILTYFGNCSLYSSTFSIANLLFLLHQCGKKCIHLLCF